MGWKSTQHAAIKHGHDRLRPALGSICDDVEKLPRADLNVNMRVLFVSHQRCGGVHHQLRQMAVQIKLGTYRNVWPHDAPHGTEQVALNIVVAYCHHSPMQCQQDEINRASCSEVFNDTVPEFLVHRPAGDAARLGHGTQAFHHCPAFGFGKRPPDRQLRRAAVQWLAGSVAISHHRLHEALPACGNRGKGVGLGVQPRHEKLHCIIPCIFCLSVHCVVVSSPHRLIASGGQPCAGCLRRCSHQVAAYQMPAARPVA